MATAIRNNPAFDWRVPLGGKLVSADEAVSHIKSGDRITMSIAQSTPFTLCAALAGRLMELDNVVLSASASLFNWDLPGNGAKFRHESFYLSPLDRGLFALDAPGEFVPLSYYRTGVLPPGLDNFNVYLMAVAPPDENGYVNFGDLQIMSKLLAQRAELVVAEIDPNKIRVGGDNAMHISEIEWFVERALDAPTLPALPLATAEEQAIVATIGAIVAHELVPDRASIQIGVGSTSGMLMPHLRNHHDLGMQTEIIPVGTAPLVRDGVITGKYKKLFPGLVVGSGFAVGTPRAELAYANSHPGFQLYDFNFTDDIRLIAREEGLISINNALAVDLTGQVGSESIGHQMYTGTGGQTAFGIGSSLGGGKSIIVLPSSAISKGERISRITPALAPGSICTLPRTFVHHVVTEYGVATLKGKSQRERARELIAVAHPDFRAELTAAAKRVLG
jgi:4-hydroxybutyrate CoA-transferase